MSCKVKREGRVVKQMTFSCDHDGCAVALTDEEIIPQGGLTKMGWDCSGGNHYCPDHRRTPAPEADQQGEQING